jgi:hypothetical protein
MIMETLPVLVLVFQRLTGIVKQYRSKRLTIWQEPYGVERSIIITKNATSYPNLGVSQLDGLIMGCGGEELAVWRECY